MEFEHLEDEDLFTLGAQSEMQRSSWFEAFMVGMV